MNASSYALVFVLLVNLASCSMLPFSNPKANTSQSKFIVKSAENKKIIVFVHGIFGDGSKSWENSEGKHFYDFVKEDTDTFGRSDIYVYEYAGDNYSIDQIATNMHTRLMNERIFNNYDRVVFVAHSMGGLITQKFLLKYPELSKKVPLAFFFATPQEGSAIANIADFLVDNRALKNLYLFDGNTFLEEMDSEWKLHRQNGTITTTIRCAYETKPTMVVLGTLIVPMGSASRYCDGESSAVNENHFDIVKPRSQDSESYQALRYAVIESEQEAKYKKTLGQKNTDKPTFKHIVQTGQRMHKRNEQSKKIARQQPRRQQPRTNIVSAKKPKKIARISRAGRVS